MLSHSKRDALSFSGQSCALMCVVLIVASLVDGALPQLQMVATGGRVFLTTGLIKALLYCLIVVATILQWSSIKPSMEGLFWLFVICYILADTFFLLLHLHISVLDAVIGINSYYAYLFLVPLASYLSGEVEVRRVYQLLIAAFVPSFLIGSAQFLLQKPILYTESIDGSFAALSWESFDGSLRAFSLFSSGLGYGGFCSLIGAICCAYFLAGKNKLFWLFLYGLAAFGCYTTYTRNCYIQFLLSTICIFSLIHLKAIVKYYPIFFLIMAVLIAVAGAAFDSSDSQLTSNVSTLMRALEWEYYLELYQAAPIIDKLFGLGVIQNAKAASDTLVVLDNQFLGVLVNIGLFGFVLVFWAQWRMWLSLYRRSLEKRTPFSLAMAGFWSTYLTVYFYNLALATFCAIFIIAVLTRDDATPQALPA